MTKLSDDAIKTYNETGVVYVVLKTKVCPKCEGKGYLVRELKWWQKYLLAWDEKIACDKECFFDPNIGAGHRVGVWVNLELVVTKEG